MFYGFKTKPWYLDLIYFLWIHFYASRNVTIFISVAAKSARKGPLPEVPSADDVILRERRKDKTHESDILTSHSKDEFNPGAKVTFICIIFLIKKTSLKFQINY